MGAALVAIAVSGCAKVTQITAGSIITCVTYDRGDVRCWGLYNSGQSVPAITQVARVAVAWDHMCVIMLDATVRCWGRNEAGQLGDGTTNDRVSPVQVSGLTDVAEIGVGYSFTCARLNDGTVRCWGDNGRGQMGDGSGTGQNDIHPTPVVASITNVKQLAIGAFHACALTNDGFVSCWGEYTTPDPDITRFHASPTPVGTLVDVVEIGATIGIDAGLCARLREGTITCSTRVRPNGNMILFDLSPVATLPDAVQIASGTAHVCARHQNGTVNCFFVEGATTNPTEDYNLHQVDVPAGIQGVTELTAGQLHTCVRSSGLAVACWGDNSRGQSGPCQALPYVLNCQFSASRDLPGSNFGPTRAFAR